MEKGIKLSRKQWEFYESSDKYMGWWIRIGVYRPTAGQGLFATKGNKYIRRIIPLGTMNGLVCRKNLEESLGKSSPK